jgi:hypothetical protein
MKFTRIISVLAALMGAVPVANAALVEYSASLIAPSQWRYDYTINVPDAPLSFDGLTVWFGSSLYAGLAGATAPSGWDPIAIESDPGLPADGFFDALLLSGSVQPGAVLTGFSVTFTYLGLGTPGAQSFALYNSLDFGAVYSGSTVLGAPVGQVPVPATMGLALLALAAAAGSTARRRR